MEIEPITSVAVAAAPALTAEYVHRAYESTTPPASPVKVELVEEQAKAVETTEQLAEDGDPLAIDELKTEQAKQTPNDARALQPAYIDHAPGAHEPGKGDRIDIYD